MAQKETQKPSDARDTVSMRPDLEARIRALPTGPGVYQFLDARGRVIYVGKAANLRARVRSYFRVSGDNRFHIERLRKQVQRIETTSTASEKDALILEDALIKQHQPRFNIKLRDDKSFLFLRLRKDDPFPYVELIRRPPDDGNPTFGPWPSARSARRTAAVLHRVFPLRTCSNAKFMHRSRPCLDHQIGRCPAPCVGKISEAQYGELVEAAERFLRGERREVERELKQRMQAASDALRFEEAALLRDQLQALEQTRDEPTVHIYGARSADYWGAASSDEGSAVMLLRTSDGQIIDQRVFAGVDPAQDPDRWSQLLLQFYRPGRLIPADVYLPIELEAAEVLADVLSERRGKRVRLHRPQRGEHRRLVELAVRNATEQATREDVDDYEQTAGELARLLHLPRPPIEIECVDISVHQGGEPVGVRVVFSQGVDHPEARRRYRLESGEGIGDPQWMQQVLRRRLTRGIEQDDLPDLIVLDGGIAQLQAVLALYRELEIEWARVPVVALAKARNVDVAEGGVERDQERVYLPNRRNPVVLRPGTRPWKLLVALRDATHRAAIGYHRNRSRHRLVAGIERIPGLGTARRQALLQAYPDLETVATLPVDEVRRATGIPAGVVRRVQEELRRLQ
ncbi:MAG: excinuclease ABC subunit UvrC [Candidatus Dadabacteria bacterium]|nr:MAG: excinuclease ABC subunit UvrC [Candidatus Dadabacteria bacterium]